MQLAAPHYCHTTVTLVRALQAMKRMSGMQKKKMQCTVTAYTFTVWGYLTHRWEVEYVEAEVYLVD